jgi:hypothetical protein
MAENAIVFGMRFAHVHLQTDIILTSVGWYGWRSIERNR